MRRLRSSAAAMPYRLAACLTGAALLALTVAGSSSARQVLPAGTEPRPAGTGVIRGRVVDPVRGVPVPRVTVTASLWRRTSPPGSSTRPPARDVVSRHVAFTARTSADGTFVLGSLPPGEFNLTAQRDGYGGRGVHRNQHVTLAAGATVVLPDIPLAGGGVITGRVLDRYGEPVIRASVTPFGRRSNEPGQPLGPMAPAVLTDDRGRFRLYSLRPGSYTVHAVPRVWRRGTPQGDPRELLPGVAGGPEFTDAEFVDVVSGEESTLDVRLADGVHGTVAGRVLTASGEPAAGVAMSLRPANLDVQYHVAGARSSGTGAFELTGVPPGRYLVVAQEWNSGTPQQSVRPRAAWTVVGVEGSRVDGVSLMLTAGATVRGRIEIDGGDAARLHERPLRLVAQPMTSGWPPGGYGEATVDPQGLTFAFPGLQGPHRLTVNDLPPGWWVKTMTIDGRDVWDGHDFPSRGDIESAVVVLSGRPTGVTGRVEALVPTDTRREPVAAMVLVVSRELPILEMALRGSGHITGVAADGTFRADGVRPGSYAVLVVGPDMIEALRDMSPDQMRAFVDAHGAAVDVVEGQYAAVTVRMVSAMSGAP